MIRLFFSVQAGDKFCILTLDRHTQRRATDRQTKFLLQFLSLRGPKRAGKEFQLNQKKKNFQDCSNVCPSGLRTFNKSLRIYHLQHKKTQDADGI